MNILLPDEFRMLDEDGNVMAEVVKEACDTGERKILKIYGAAITQQNGVEKIMYELTKAIRGMKCYYCGCTLTSETATIDHIIPRVYGGFSIPNNLVVACQKCNSEKGNLMEDEYLYFRTLKTKKEKRAYIKSLKEIQEDRYYGNVPVLPEDWISKNPFSELILKIYPSEPLGAKYKRTKWFISKFKRYKDCVVTSRNGVVLDGFIIIFWAKLNNRSDYKQINLDNVHVVV